MSVQMVKCAICLFASLPTAFVHPLDFFISSSRSFVLLRSRDGYEGINLLRTILSMKSATSHKIYRRTRFGAHDD
ncbi:hypothetical protein F4804DRAFT_223039 [Jackrogersella minutella]|nr:hypothetical protein F4804DRAFT_223039 [Jackrogersella minutella]